MLIDVRQGIKQLLVVHFTAIMGAIIYCFHSSCFSVTTFICIYMQGIQELADTVEGVEVLS